MSLNIIKVIAIALLLVPMLAVVAFRTDPVSANKVSADDPAAIYKAKCAMCHTPTASKFFDTTKSDDEMVAAILNGKKGEKPPFMPAFADKGINADQAKALVEYMKTLKTAAK